MGGPDQGAVAQLGQVQAHLAQGGGQAAGPPLHPCHAPAQLAQFGDGLMRFQLLTAAGAIPAALLPLRTLGRQGLQLDRGELAGKHQALHQRVAGQPIGAMDAGAGHFTHGVQPRQAGGGLEIGGDAAHPVVGRWRHGDRLGCGLKAQVAAAPQDRRELAFEAFLPHRPQVEPEVIHRLGLHAAGQGPTHLVARGQITAGEIGHRAASGTVLQPGSLTSYRL